MINCNIVKSCGCLMDESFHNGKAIIWQIRDVCCNAFLEGGTFVLWPAEATGLSFGSFL